MRKKKVKKPQTIPNNRVSSNILIFLFLFLLPTQLGKHFFFDFSYISAVRIDYLAPTLFLTDILALLLVILNVKKVIALFRNKFFLIFLGLLIINIFTSLSQPLAVYKSLKILEVIFLFVIFKDTIVSPKLILYSFLSGAIVQLGLTLLQFYFKHSVQGIFYFLGERYFTLSTPGIAKMSYQGVEFLRAYGTFSHPNSLAGFYLLIHAFVLTYKPFDKFPILKYALLGISAALILITFSKIVILGFFLVTFIYTLTHAVELKCEFCMGARIVVAGLLTLLFSMAQGDPLSGQTRIDLAKNALEIIKNHMIVGVGLGNYLLAQSKYAIKVPYFFLQPVHNIFLLFLAEAGLVISGYLFYLLWKIRKTIVDNQCLMYCVGVIVFTGMFDHYWLTLQQNMLLAATFFGLAYASQSPSGRG